jgi:hypothetical protein
MKRLPTIVSTDFVLSRLQRIRVLDGSMPFADFEADFRKHRIPGA